MKLETGQVLQERDIPGAVFRRGHRRLEGPPDRTHLETHLGFIYDLATFQPRGQFDYPGEGWGLTQDGKRIIMSDGTPQTALLGPGDAEGDRPASPSPPTASRCADLNELEWVKGEIYANIWQTNRIARIDPASGKVVGWIDLTGLLSPAA